MNRIQSPPDVVAMAASKAIPHSAAGLLIGYDLDKAAPSLDELATILPHLDNASLVLVCEYISSLGDGLARRFREQGECKAVFNALADVGSAFSAMTVVAANRMTDEVLASE